MKKKTQKQLDTFLEKLAERNPHQPEFQQAVKEVLQSVVPYMAQHEKYQNQALLERITEPERIITFRVVWQDDDGALHVNRGYRVQFNSAIGPYKGGIRFTPTVTPSVLKFLAFEQIFKNSLTGLPMGGGKGGSDFNPRDRSDSEVMRFCQAFMTELYRHIGPDTDIPAGDINVSAREIGYLYGQYKKIANVHQPVLTGKGLAYGGSKIRTEATGYGNVFFMREMLKRVGKEIEGTTAVVSGSGNVAQHTAEKWIALGGKVLAMSDSDGTIYDESGISQEKLEWIKDLKNNKRGRIKEYAKEFDAEFREGKKPWDIKSDVAFPCATQNEIEKKDAEKLVKNGCQALSEGANMPCTEAAMEVLRDSDILYAPGKASNAGGVAVSGLEISQNILRLSWSREEVEERLEKIMQEIHEKCLEYGIDDNGNADYVKGANIAGFVKVADAMIALGV